MNVASQQQTQLTINPEQIDANDFPHYGTTKAKLKFMLNYAVLAPSIGNIQPWSFRINNDTIELYQDTSRTLPVVDPDNKELIISCGAALFYLHIAIRHFGYQDLVEILPESDNSLLLARICLGTRRIVKAEENFLFHAIVKRSTNRFLFKNMRLSASLISELESAICNAEDWLQIMTQKVPARNLEAIFNLMAHGDRLQMADPQFRQELAYWIQANNHPDHDDQASPTQEVDQRLAIASLISFAIRTFAPGQLLGSQDKPTAWLCDRQPIKNASVLIIISSRGDTVEDWLATGEALAHILLRARVDNFWASCFNQPREISQASAFWHMGQQPLSGTCSQHSWQATKDEQKDDEHRLKLSLPDQIAFRRSSRSHLMGHAALLARIRSRLQNLFSENGYPQLLLSLDHG